MLVVQRDYIINLAQVIGIRPGQDEETNKFRLIFNFDTEFAFLNFDTAEEVKAAFDKILKDLEEGKAVCRL